MRNFKELSVWQKARIIVKRIYDISNQFPPSERFGITNQLRRAAVSISSNIAEGCGRRTDAEFMRFIDISIGSATEVESLCFVSFDLGYFPESELIAILQLVNEVQKMLLGLYNSINNKFSKVA
ncbi:MAG: four helix bundle protein [Chitinophagales bacterium]